VVRERFSQRRGGDRRNDGLFVRRRDEMRDAIRWLGVVAWIAAAAGSAGAQANNCTWNGQEFAEGMDVCQNGLRQRCMNGTWQSNNGERCDGDDGATERMRLLEQEQEVEED
jgi:hypothetical protein